MVGKRKKAWQDIDTVLKHCGQQKYPVQKRSSSRWPIGFDTLLELNASALPGNNRFLFLLPPETLFHKDFISGKGI